MKEELTEAQPDEMGVDHREQFYYRWGGRNANLIWVPLPFKTVSSSKVFLASSTMLRGKRSSLEALSAAADSTTMGPERGSQAA